MATWHAAVMPGFTLGNPTGPVQNPYMIRSNSNVLTAMQIMQIMNAQVRKPLKLLGLRAFYIDREIPGNSTILFLIERRRDVDSD